MRGSCERYKGIWVSEGTTLNTLNFGTQWRRVAQFHAQVALILRKDFPVLTNREIRWARGSGLGASWPFHISKCDIISRMN